jgi:hypothetical protein
MSTFAKFNKDDLINLGWYDIHFIPMSYKNMIKAKVKKKVGKSIYELNFTSFAHRRKTTATSICALISCLIDDFDVFLGLSYKQKLEWIENTGSKKINGK